MQLKMKQIQPLVSIIIPHIWEHRLDVTLSSIKHQTYRDIEIIVQPDRGEKNANVLRNRGESGCNGHFLFFCDDDIDLEEDCIQKMADVLINNPKISFVYSDYRKTGCVQGIEYGQPWDFEQLKKRNYISTMSLVRRSHFILAGRFDESLNRYQDWDLWLRMGGLSLKGHYINEVLFSAHFTSKGISMQGPYDRKISTEIIKRKHCITNRTYTIILPVHNQIKYTKQCIDSIIRNTGGDYELIIIDDFSSDETTGYFKHWINFAEVWTHDKRKHHTYCCNEGIEGTNGEYIILLNNDTLVSKNWNVKLVDNFKKLKDASCIGPLTSYAASPQQLESLYPHRYEIQPSEIDILQKDIENSILPECFKAKITGFCLVTSRKLWNKVGPFSSAIPAGGNEADWIIRAHAMGLYPYIDTSVYVHHYGNRSYEHENKKGLWDIGRDMLMKNYDMKEINWLENIMYIKILEDKKLGIDRGSAENPSG